MVGDLAFAQDGVNSQQPAFKVEVNAVIQALTGKINRRGEFTAARYDRLAEALEQAQDDDEGKQLLKNAQDFAKGKIEEDLFVTYLESKLKYPRDRPLTASAIHVPDPVRNPSDVVARVGRTEIRMVQLEPSVAAYLKQVSARGKAVSQEQIGRVRYDVLNEMITRELVLQQVNGDEPPNLGVRVRAEIDKAKR